MGNRVTATILSGLPPAAQRPLAGHSAWLNQLGRDSAWLNRYRTEELLAKWRIQEMQRTWEVL